MKIAPTVFCISLLLALAGLAFANPVGEIIIVGSDVISNHGNQGPFSIALFNDLSEFSTKPILVLDNIYVNGPGYIGGTGFDFETSLAGLNLSNYSAIWLASPDRCCGDLSPFLSVSDAQAIHNFQMSGGNIGIENFLGMGACTTYGVNLAIWDIIFQFDPSPGLIGTGCDNAVDLFNAYATPQGINDGFPASGYEDIWNHQVYDPTFWTAHDYIPIMTAGDPSYGQWNVLEGNTPEGETPEPSSFLLLGTSVLGISAVVRRRNAIRFCR